MAPKDDWRLTITADGRVVRQDALLDDDAQVGEAREVPPVANGDNEERSDATSTMSGDSAADASIEDVGEAPRDRVGFDGRPIRRTALGETGFSANTNGTFSDGGGMAGFGAG